MPDVTCPHCAAGDSITTHPIVGSSGWHSVSYEDGDYVECPAFQFAVPHEKQLAPVVHDSHGNVRPLRQGIDAITTFVRVHSFSSIDDPLSRDRPYTGQAHTYMGERGAQQVRPVTYRDIGDALHEALTELDANPYCTDRNDWDLTAVVQNALTRLQRKTNGKNTD